MADMNNTGKNYAAVDGEAVISVQPDFSSAYLTIYPPRDGGKEITYEKIIEALGLKAVRCNIKHDLIKSMLEDGMYGKEVQVAAAIKPVDGKDGFVKYNYPKEMDLAPVEDEKGYVDYKNLGLIRNIHKGEIIAEITQPVEGKDGADVRGVPLRYTPGRKPDYKIGTNTLLSEDGTKITAACDGHIRWTGNAFAVETTVTINGDIDASVGNIDFIGDVIVKGEVCEGFSVTSAKNITIMGNVTNAKLKAGECITVKKGAINSELTAHGDIVCQFAEYTKFVSDSNFTAQDLVVCDIYCAGDLSVKHLRGGKCVCLGGVNAVDIGTKSYAATEIIAGDNAVLTKEKETAEKRIIELESLIQRVQQIIDFLVEKKKQLGKLPEDKALLQIQSAKSIILYKQEIKTLTKRIAEINDSLAVKQGRVIYVKGILYPGVKITIDSASAKFDTETHRVRVYLNDSGEIATGIL